MAKDSNTKNNNKNDVLSKDESSTKFSDDKVVASNKKATTQKTKAKKQNHKKNVDQSNNNHINININSKEFVKKAIKNLNKIDDPYQGCVSRQEFDRIRKTSGLLRFSGLYSEKRVWVRYLIIAIGALFFGFISLIFVKNTGLYSAGLGGIFQGIARFTQTAMLQGSPAMVAAAPTVYNVLFWGLYFIANLPLCLFAYYKIDKRFAKLSFLYLGLNNLFGLALSFIPELSTFSIFGNIQSTDNLLTSNSIVLLDWDFGQGDGDLAQIVPLIFAATVYSIIGIIWYAVMYISGGSSGGGDIIGMWYSKKKKKSLGFSLMIINMVCIFISATIGSFGSSCLVEPVQITRLISPNLLCSIASAIMIGIGVNTLYPRYKIIQVHVYTLKGMKIRDNLFNKKYIHTVTIHNNIGGYSLDPVQRITTVCTYTELPRVVNAIREIDPDGMIITVKIRDFDGYIKIEK